MQTSRESSTQARIQLKSWIQTNVNLDGYLTPPKELEKLTSSDRQGAEFKDRDDAATKFLNIYLGSNPEFTDIMHKLTDSRGNEGRATFRSAIREALCEMQKSTWAEFTRPKGSRNRKPAVV